AFLRKKIRPAETVTRIRLDRLIADLDSDEFQVRESATAELEKVGNQAAQAMRQTIEAKPNLEVQRRLQRVLDALKKGPTGEELRHLRAVHALELAGTAEARKVLRAWAGGTDDARLTQAAKAAVKRLEARPR